MWRPEVNFRWYISGHCAIYLEIFVVDVFFSFFWLFLCFWDNIFHRSGTSLCVDGSHTASSFSSYSRASGEDHLSPSSFLPFLVPMALSCSDYPVGFYDCSFLISFGRSSLCLALWILKLLVPGISLYTFFLGVLTHSSTLESWESIVAYVLLLRPQL